MAIYLAIKHFRHRLEGRIFIIYTDHKPLIFAFKQNLDRAAPRQARHLDLIGQFSTDIRHVSEKDNIVADALSRISAISYPTAIDYEQLASEQEMDSDLQIILNSKSLKIEKYTISGSLTKMYCDVSTGVNRPFVPKCYRQKVFQQFHRLSHPGVRSTVEHICKRFIWPSMEKDCTEWTLKVALSARR